MKANAHRKSARRKSSNARRLRSRGVSLEQLESRWLLTLLGQQLFPADNPWNENIASAPVAANSDAIINNIITVDGNGHLHPDFGQDTHGSNPLYGIPYNVVHGNTQAKVPVVIDAYASESDVQDAPIPANAVLEGDVQNGPTVGLANRGDSHLIVFDVDNDVAYEFFAASRPSENSDGKWHADQESVWDMKTNTFRTLGYTSADAAGLPILPGLTRPDEGLPTSEGGQGAIDHALRFTLKNNIILDQFLYPAEHIANSNSNAAVDPPMGARFRLKANVDISQLNPESQVIAQALKTYGMIVADNGSNFFLSGASDSVNASNQDTLTWNDADIQDTTHGLKSLPFSDFEVVDLTPQVSGLSTASGAAGSTLTVTGQNFSGAAGHLQVLFGNTPATNVTVVDDGHVTATVPQGSGTVDVRVQSGVTTASDTENINNPIFGYGVSPTSANDKFTYSSGGGGGNQAPVAQNDTATTNENTAVKINVLANDNDPDGDALSVASVTQPGHGAAAINSDNTVTYTPASGFSGNDTFNYTVSDGHGNTATASVSVTVNASGGTLTSQPTTITPTEGHTFTGAVGSFLNSPSGGLGANNLAALSTPSATIDWGDGSSVTTGTITTGTNGALVVGGSHVYAEEAIGLPVTVTISDLGITATAVSTANVADAPLTAATATIAASQGNSFVGPVATFTDANPNAAATDFTATINWGDGNTTTGTVSGAAGEFTVLGTHTYTGAAATEPVTAVVRDIGGSVASAVSTATITAASLTATPQAIIATEGTTFNGTLATFTDSNPLLAAGVFTATINWGDGSSATTGTITPEAGSAFSVGGSHVYAEEAASLPVSITIAPTGGVAVSTVATANVADAPLSASPVRAEFASGVGSSQLLAKFSDAGGAMPASNYSAVVHWGDGTSGSASIASTSSGLQVFGNHTYASAGIFPVSVQIKDQGGAAADVPGQAVVSSPTAQSNNELLVDAAYQSLLGRSVDPGSLSYWMTQLGAGANRYDLAQTLLHSPEHATEAVAAAYQKLLHRSADTDGLNYWIGRLNSGLTQDNLAAGIVASPEYLQKAGTPSSWVAAAYQDLLGRPTDPPGQAYWLQQMNAGASRYDIASRLLAGHEGQLAQIANAYQQYLGRPVDGGALAYWSNQLDQGVSPRDMVASLVSSQEFFDRATER